MNLRLKVFLICLLLAGGTVYGQEITWMAYGKIENPADIWEQIKSISELEPIFKAAKEHIADFEENYKNNFFDPQFLEKTLYIGVGTQAKHRRSSWHLWEKDKQNNVSYLGNAGNLYRLLVKQNSRNRKEGRQEKDMQLPAVFARLSPGKQIEIKITSDAQADILSAALEKYMARRNKIKNAEPTSKVRQAQAMLSVLQNCSALTLQFSKDERQLTFGVEYNEQAVKNKKGLNEWVDTLQWFVIPGQFYKATPAAGMQVIAYPRLHDLVQKKLQSGPPPLPLKPDEIMALLPARPLMLYVFGSFNPMSMSLPLSINLPIEHDKALTLIDTFIQSGMPLPITDGELQGRQVKEADLSGMIGAFNRRQQSNDALKLYVFADQAQGTWLCMGRENAVNTIAADNGELQSAEIWSDVQSEVKLALAWRLDLVAGLILEQLNQMAMRNESRTCSDGLHRWTNKNRDLAESLKDGDEIPAELQACCPRGGLMVKQGRINCAVHNYRAMSKITTQLFNAAIPVGRWLRLYLTRHRNKSMFILDFKDAREVK